MLIVRVVVIAYVGAIVVVRLRVRGVENGLLITVLAGRDVSQRYGKVHVRHGVQPTRAVDEELQRKSDSKG